MNDRIRNHSQGIASDCATADGVKRSARLGRRWFQFSLRSLFIFVALVSLPLAWFGNWFREVTEEHRCITALRKGVDIDARRRYGRVVHLELSSSEPKNVDDELAMLEGLPELTILQLSDQVAVTDTGLKHLENLTQLRGLGLGASGVTDSGIAVLASLQNLRNLVLADTEVGDAGMAHVARLENLRRLLLDGTRVSDARLEHLAGLSNLKYLSLSGTGVTDSGLAHLAGLSALETLWLDDTQVTGVGLVHLKGLRNLWFVSLDGTNVTDGDLQYVVECVVTLDVGELRLSDTQVSDAGLEQLKRLANVKELDLVGTNLSKQGFEELQQALPETEVYWSRRGGPERSDPEE